MKINPVAVLLVILVPCLLVSCDQGVVEVAQPSNNLSTSETSVFAGNGLSKLIHEEGEAHYRNMVDQIKNMSVSQIMNMSDNELLALGAPLRNMTSKTILLSEEVLEQLDDLVHELIEHVRNQNTEGYHRLSEQISTIITPYRGYEHSKRELGPDKLREVFLDIKSKQVSLSEQHSQDVNAAFAPSLYGVEMTLVSDSERAFEVEVVTRAEYDFLVGRIKSMTPFEIRSLTDREVLEIGRPLQLMINSGLNPV